MHRPTDPSRPPPPAETPTPAATGSVAWEALGLALVATAAFAVRWPFRRAPLIRDEGELAQLGQAILQGAVPYLDVYNQKPPVTHYGMALLQAVAGPDLAVLRVATTLYGLATLVLVALLARRLAGPLAGQTAAAAFALLALVPTAVAHSSSTEFYMLPFGVATLLLWLRGGAGAAVAAGACAALACQTKQTGLVLLIFLASDVAWRAWRGRDPRGRELAAAVAGFGAAMALVLGWFAAQGALTEYVQCVWTHNFAYVGSRQGGLAQWTALVAAVAESVGPGRAALWLLGALGLGALALDRSNEGSGLWILFAGSLAAAFLAGAPFSHYYHPVAVPAALGVGVAMSRCWTGPRGRLRFVATASALLFWLPAGARLLRTVRDPAATLDATYAGLFPAREAPRIAAYVAERTGPGEPFVVIGSEPELYFLADRPPASRMVFSYPMSGRFPHAARLRQELIDTLEREDRPRYAVFVGHPASLATNEEDARRFVRHVSPALRAHYAVETTIPDDPERPHVVVYRRKGSE
jgi:4-amino-4-deoxy-L-arabinose transferase-like glycosyltransferase